MQIKLTKHEMSFKKSAKQIGANIMNSLSSYSSIQRSKLYGQLKTKRIMISVLCYNGWIKDWNDYICCVNKDSKAWECP